MHLHYSPSPNEVSVLLSPEIAGTWEVLIEAI